MELKQEIERIAEDLEGDIGVSVKNLESGESISVNGDRPFNTATVFKVFVAAQFLRQVEEGLVRLDDEYVMKREDIVPGSGVLMNMHPGLRVTIRDLLTLMIVVSDNSATDLLMDRLGLQEIEKFVANLGLTNTKI